MSEDIIIFDHTGRIIAKVPFLISAATPPVRGVHYWDIDAQGNIYHLSGRRKPWRCGACLLVLLCLVS